jgi:hypothetical protein
MAAAAQAASEPFKIAVRKLGSAVLNPSRLSSVFADVPEIVIALASPGTPTINALGALDCVSAGAITQSMLYVLSRLPGVTGSFRVIDHDRADLTNLNRYLMLLLRHAIGTAPKADLLSLLCAGTGWAVEPVGKRYGPGEGIVLRPTVLVGVDDVPTRWHVQRSRPGWLGIGATTHWSAMASFHAVGARLRRVLRRLIASTPFSARPVGQPARLP